MNDPENISSDKVETVKPLRFRVVASLPPKRRCKIQVGPQQKLVLESLPTPIVAKQGRPPRIHRSHPPLQIWRSPVVETHSIPPAKSRITPMLRELTELVARASLSLANLQHSPYALL
jgi:hypothetical protein